MIEEKENKEKKKINLKFISKEPQLSRNNFDYSHILSFDPINNFLKDLVTKYIDPPFSIAINGPWGSGKTTTLLTLKRQLTDPNYGYKNNIICFNPWEYERTGDVVFAFMQRMMLEIKDRFSFLQDFGIFSITLMLTGFDYVLRYFTSNQLSYSNVKEILNDVDNSLKNKFKNYNNVIEDLKKDFTKITNKIYQRTKKPLIILLDDLDRCLPENGINLIELIKNLFVIENTKVIFVFGINLEVMKNFLNKKYESIDKDFSYNYFNKIFNLIINLPLIQYKHLRLELVYKLENLSMEKLIPVELLNEMIVGFNIRNYRSIDNIINYLAILYCMLDYKVPHFLSSEKNEKIIFKRDIELLIFLTILKEKWSYIYEELIAESRKVKSLYLEEFFKKYKEINMADIINERLKTRNCKNIIDCYSSLLFAFHEGYDSIP